jgi:hypothetical protein
MLTIWTIASLINSVYVVPLISLAMLLYKRYIKKINRENKEEMILITVAGVISYFYNNYLVISILTQFGPKLLFNKITFIMIKTVYKSVRQKIYKIFIRNKDLAISYLITILYAIALKTINIHDNYLIIGLNIIANILMSVEIKKQIIFGILLCSVQLSNFEVVHIIFNSLILYLMTGLIDISNIVTTQDYLRTYIDSVFSQIKLLTWLTIHNIRLIYEKYLLLRSLFREKLKKCVLLIFSDKKERNKKIIFELMDKDKFPSITVNSFKSNIYSSFRDDSVSIDDDIFMQPEDAFIQGISIDDNENNGSYKVTKKKNSDSFSIHDNYFD